MSTRYNTQNPIESDDVRDMSDNAKNFDEFVNSASDEFTDRLGIERKTIHGMNSEFDSQILNMGFTRVGTFAAGATLTNPRQTLLWDIADGGDGQEYGWSGSFLPSGKVVPPGSTPLTTGGIAVGAWMSRFDPELRVQVREALRRTYAETGLTLVAGSFQAGFTLTGANDVALDEASGKAYSGAIGTYPAGTSTAGFTDKSNELLIEDSLVAVKQPFTGAATRTQHDKNLELLSMADFTSASAAVAAAIAQTNALLFNNPNTFNLTVGVGGQFATISDAITAAFRIRPIWKKGNGFCNIRLNSGFVLNEQLSFGGGVDFSWIRITSQDAVVYADTSAFTTFVRTYYNYKYLFYFYDGAKSPVFQIQIEENRGNSDVCAFVVTQSARLHFYQKCGARKFYVGIHASFGAVVAAYHTGSAADQGSVALYKPAGYYVCDFSNSVYSSIQAVNNCIISMPVSRFSNCVSTVASVNLIYNCFGDFQGSYADDCYIGWNCRDSSILNIRDHMTRRCTYRGLTMIHNSHCDARRHDVDEASSVPGITGKVLEPGIQKGFYGCALGARIDGAGTLDLAGNDMRNCGVAVNADTGAVVSAKGLDVSGATICAFRCQSGSVVASPRLYAANVAKFCELEYGAKMNGRWLYATTPVTFEQNTRFFDLRVGSELHYSDSVVVGDSSIIAEEGSRMTLDGSQLKLRAVRSFSGANVALTESTMDPTYNRNQPVGSTATEQYVVSGGGIMTVVTCPNTDSSAKTLNISKNTVVAAGIIFDA